MESYHTITYKTIEEQDLSSIEKNLHAEAIAALDKSYAPYSNFKVGCSLLLDNGAFISGANQEVASYPVCICAEGVALSTASSMYPGIGIKALFIVAKNKKGILNEIIAPCGVCRQRIAEYEVRQNRAIAIYLRGKNNSIAVFNSAKDLLPFAFGPEHLPINN
jgi:cytidine deaminase